VRRGVAPALALAAASAGGAARAAVPTGLAESTVVYAATASAVPTSVAVITEGVLIFMFLQKVKLVTAVPGRSFSSVFVAPFHLPFRKASRQNSCLVFLF
jgi:hypothetical protein